MKKGAEHHRWKGDKAGYNKVHDWIRANWNKPKRCQQCKKIKKLDWANVSGKYLRSDRKDWLALCRLCHVRRDMTDERRQQIILAQKKRIYKSKPNI